MSTQHESVISKPNHYNQGTMETRFIIKHCTIGLSGIVAVYVGNIIKYLQRAPFKNGVEDIEKANQYLTFLYEEVKEGQRFIDINALAREMGGSARIWSKVYEMYEGEQREIAIQIVKELNQILIRVDGQHKRFIKVEALFINLFRLMELDLDGEA